MGGLVAAAAFVLYGFAHGVEEARSLLRVNTISLLGVGLLLALVSGLLPLLRGESFMTGLWLHHAVPVLGKLGTPVVFDMGVYLVVLGATLTVLYALAEE